MMKFYQWFKRVFAGVSTLGSEVQRKRFLRVAKVLLLASAGALVIPEIAVAAPWDAAVTAVGATLQGTLGKTIAIVAVIALGLMAMAGKLEWGHAIKVVVGVVIMFSAGQIINWVAPDAQVDTRIAIRNNTDTVDAFNAGDCAAAGGSWINARDERRNLKGEITTSGRSAYCSSGSFATATVSTCTGLGGTWTPDETVTGDNPSTVAVETSYTIPAFCS
jgi:type IV secretion system protein VirB2